MIEDLKTHLVHYLVLILILGSGFLAFWYFTKDSVSQFLAILTTAFSYLVWGIIHHWLEDNLNLKIVVEYILFAALGVAIFSLVLKGGI